MIRRVALVLLAAGGLGTGAARAQDEAARWRAEAARVEITRDDWGLAHVHGRSDADAVFGAIYAQAEDDFGRVEANYLTALGRTAEADGEGQIWQDLRQRLYVSPAKLRAEYDASPPWLRRLMDAWADGLNFYLATHPGVHPKVLTRWRPEWALAFTEGSIGGDIERIDLKALRAFYDPPTPQAAAGPTPLELADRRRWREPTGSNGVAIAPRDTRTGRALLLINPHTSFYFRSELQMTSDEGLDAYGASTWGQFFIYQGFNEHAGWMHTSSGVDAVDEFAERLTPQGASNAPAYLYGGVARPMGVERITIRYRRPDGGFGERSFTTYRTHHGPIVRRDGDRWIAFAMMDRPVAALSQSVLRTKAHDLRGFLAVADRYKANSSNNTIFADDRGEIAYLHPQFIPVRNDRFDYRHPVDGADPATDWKGDTAFADTPHLLNPASGFVYNTNDQPWAAAGPGSLDPHAFPRYMDQWGWNPRSDHVLKLLAGRRDFDLPGLNAAAFDSWQPEFAKLIPPLVRAWDALPAADPRKARLAAPVSRLRGWDDRWGAASVPNTVATAYGEQLWLHAAAPAQAAGVSTYRWIEQRVGDADRLQALDEAVAKLAADYGRWDVPWGEVNRFQRLDDAIRPHFDDARPSIPVPFASAQWGSLASFGAHAYPNTRKRYGSSGNSFVAVVEFGPRVRAVAVTAGGESGRPGSPHFDDEAGRYASGALREVYFHPDQLAGHVERRYRPGDVTGDNPGDVSGGAPVTAPPGPASAAQRP